MIGGACSANGSVSLAVGENKTCTITNQRLPRLTVVKHVINNNGGQALASAWNISVSNAPGSPKPGSETGDTRTRRRSAPTR